MINILVSVLEQILGEVLGKQLEDAFDKRSLHRALSAAVKHAEERFSQEYRAHDAEMVDALVMRTRFADLPSVQAALRDLLTHPFHNSSVPIATLQRSFTDVLPARVERDRVDAAVTAFLQFVRREVLYIPQLRDLYALAFQKASAENSRDIATYTAALVQGISELRDDIKQLPITTTPLALLIPRDACMGYQPRQRVCFSTSCGP